MGLFVGSATCLLLLKLSSMIEFMGLNIFLLWDVPARTQLASRCSFYDDSLARCIARALFFS